MKTDKPETNAPTRTIEMLFWSYNGRPVPCAPRDRAGRPLAANGDDLFDISSAVILFEMSEQALRQLYIDAIGALLAPADAKALNVKSGEAALVIRSSEDVPVYSRPAFDEYRRLYTRVFQLMDFVNDAYPEHVGLRSLFYAVIDDKGSGYHPSAAECRVLIEAFEALPIEERRRVLRGWNPVFEAVTADQIRDGIENYAKGSVQRILTLNPNNDGRMFACFDYTNDESTAPISLYIREGARREDVLRDLTTAINFVRTSYNVAIDNPDAGEAHFRQVMTRRILSENAEKLADARDTRDEEKLDALKSSIAALSLSDIEAAAREAGIASKAAVEFLEQIENPSRKRGEAPSTVPTEGDEEVNHLQPLFIWYLHRPIPFPPRTDSGYVNGPDGEIVVTLAQAAEQSQRSVADLINLYRERMLPLLTDDDRQAIAAQLDKLSPGSCAAA